MQIEQKVCDLLEARRQHGFGCGAYRHGRGVVALVKVVIVAVPLQIQALARSLVPDLWQVHRADGAVVWHVEDVELGGIERVHLAATLGWTTVLPRVINLLQQPVLGDRDDEGPIDESFQK